MDALYGCGWEEEREKRSQPSPSCGVTTCHEIGMQRLQRVGKRDSRSGDEMRYEKRKDEGCGQKGSDEV
jgi:hypothetical protein